MLSYWTSLHLLSAFSVCRDLLWYFERVKNWMLSWIVSWSGWILHYSLIVKTFLVDSCYSEYLFWPSLFLQLLHHYQVSLCHSLSPLALSNFEFVWHLRRLFEGLSLSSVCHRYQMVLAVYLSSINYHLIQMLFEHYSTITRSAEAYSI